MVTQTPLSGGRGWLTPRAAASIHRIDRALGRELQITEAGRTWDRQRQHWDAYQAYLAGTGPWAAIALHPDAPSIHQLGEAVDTDEWTAHDALLREHGWVRTVYRGGVLVEPWHYEYRPENDQHIHDAAPSGTDLTEAEMTEILKRLDRIETRQKSIESKLAWLQARVGGTTGNKAKGWAPSKTIEHRLTWIADRIGGSYTQDSVATKLAAIHNDVEQIES